MLKTKNPELSIMSRLKNIFSRLFLFALFVATASIVNAQEQAPPKWIEFDPEVFEEVDVFESNFFQGDALGDDFFEEVAKQRERETPNYNFSLDSLGAFMPGTELAQIRAGEHGPGERMKQTANTEIHKFYVAHIRYKFPVFVQTHQGRVVDFMARLPNYFLHDVFHQSLINRYGKQDRYFKKEPHAIYRWNDVEGNGLTYAGACTITCFPIYLAVTANQVNIGGYQSIPEQFSSLSQND